VSAFNNPTSYLWLIVPSLGFFAFLGVYAWQRRAMPAALPFAFFCLIAGLWTLAHGLEMSATSPAAHLFWSQFMIVCQLPAATALFCFVLHYAGYGRRLSPPVYAVLALPSLLLVLLLLTNDQHHLFLWLQPTPLGVVARPGPTGRLMFAISLAFLLANWFILGRLILRSPIDRWPAALILLALLLMRIGQFLDFSDLNPISPLSTTVLSFIPAAAIFALVLFVYRIFDPVQLAREALTDQMADGMMVLDPANKIADLNRAAELILGVNTRRARGQSAADLLPSAALPAGGVVQQEATLVTGPDNDRRYFTVQSSPLRDRRGLLHGRLLLLHDVTEQRLAAAQLLEQQRAWATLRERERLANELHDSAGQVLAYVSLQAQAIRKRVLDGDTAAAAAQLTQLADAAQGAHVDVREAILSLKAASAERRPFADTLSRYLATYADHYGVAIDLQVADGLGDPFAPEAGVQVLRVIQEALTNARKHGQAQHVAVEVGRENGDARVIVADDGRGFDATAPGDDHFGLAIMRERMAQIGGRLLIDSQPGRGTRVVLHAPIAHPEGNHAHSVS